jgi:hypothetical protein
MSNFTENGLLCIAVFYFNYSANVNRFYQFQGRKMKQLIHKISTLSGYTLKKTSRE